MKGKVMKPSQAAADITRREVLRSRAGTVVWGCFAGVLLAGLCAGAETQARPPSAPPDSGIQDGAVRPREDWASAMASVPSDPAQWPSVIPPGEVPKQKPDPTILILTPIGDRFPLECDWFLQDWAPQSPSNECRNNFPKLMLIERRLFWSNRNLRAGIAGREEGAAS